VAEILFKFGRFLFKFGFSWGDSSGILQKSADFSAIFASSGQIFAEIGAIKINKLTFNIWISELGKNWMAALSRANRERLESSPNVALVFGGNLQFSSGSSYIL
jgi:hypothetical protein